ncbi:MAG: pilus assembly protein PilP [Desulfobacterales bacterium]|uniref:Pilus assembly protein PilP n=1 Tax=Candidatus Desulfatibia vada TaxID=2841696 RepID=A0A8J6P0B7_9BACT|nr:pilus assembly protein PilP [Candidatus Desulfatibia vada]
MLKYPAAIRTIICFLCLLPLIWGCDQQAEAPPKPKVITKKIVAKKKAAVPKKLQKVDTAKPEIKKQAPEPKATVATKQMPEPKTAAVVKQMPEPKTIIAAAQPPESKVKTAQKTTLKPKTKLPAVTTQAESEAKDKKLVASLAPTVQKLVVRDSTNIYNPQGKLDPFEPLLKEKEVAAVMPRKKTEKRKPLTPLEKLDLSQLQLVGVIRSLSGNRALVEDATGKGYVVTKGTYIGTRSGKIVEILADRVIVAEEVENIYGKVSVQKRPLIIQKPPGE